MNLKGIRQVGEILNSHGVRGAVKVASLTSYPEIFAEINEVVLIKGDKRMKYPVTKTGSVKNHCLLKLDGIDDPDAAKRFKNFGVYVNEELLRPLVEDEFMISDLIQARVYSSDDEYLGVIVDYIDNGEHGICEVEDNTTRFLFPTTKEVLREIIPEKKVIINLLPGLRELNIKKPQD